MSKKQKKHFLSRTKETTLKSIQQNLARESTVLLNSLGIHEMYCFSKIFLQPQRKLYNPKENSTIPYQRLLWRRNLVHQVLCITSSVKTKAILSWPLTPLPTSFLGKSPTKIFKVPFHLNSSANPSHSITPRPTSILT